MDHPKFCRRAKRQEAGEPNICPASPSLLGLILDPLLQHLEPSCLRTVRLVCMATRSQVDPSIHRLTAPRNVLTRDIEAAGRRWPNVNSLSLVLQMLPPVPPHLQPAHTLAAAAAAFTLLRHVDMVSYLSASFPAASAVIPTHTNSCVHA